MASSTASRAERRRRLAAFVALAVTMVAVTTVATTAGAESAAPAKASAGASASAAAAAAAPVPAPAPVGDLSSLLAGMRSSPGVVAHFTETREIALLSSPLAATGTISFVPPGRLVRLVTSPGRSRLVVDGSKVRFEDVAGSKGLDLSASPMARQMVDSFVVLFSGDEARLKELYSTEYRADGDTWTLKLVPRSAPLDRMIASFELQGRDSRIDRMVAAEPDGDRTITLFGETDVQHRFGEKELADLFAEKPGT